MFAVETPTKRDLQLLVVVVSVEVESDMINPELEPVCCLRPDNRLQYLKSCLLATTEISVSNKRYYLSSCPLVYLFTNTPPKSGASPSELDDTSKYDYTKATSSWNKWPFKILLAIWCFAGDFFEIGPLLLLILAMPKILHVFFKLWLFFQLLLCSHYQVQKQAKMDRVRDENKMFHVITHTSLYRTLTSRIKAAPVHHLPPGRSSWLLYSWSSGGRAARWVHNTVKSSLECPEDQIWKK